MAMIKGSKDYTFEDEIRQILDVWMGLQRLALWMEIQPSFNPQGPGAKALAAIDKLEDAFRECVQTLYSIDDDK